MAFPDTTQFLGLPSPGYEQADARMLPVPIEKTVSYGTGTGGGPKAIIEASFQLEPFDEETLVDFNEGPRIHTLPPVGSVGDLEDCLTRIRETVRPLRDKFLVSLGGEHGVTYGLVTGLVDDPTQVTIVQIDAHADLADDLLRQAVVARHGDAAALGAWLRAGADRHPQPDASRAYGGDGRPAHHNVLRPSHGRTVGRDSGNASPT